MSMLPWFSNLFDCPGLTGWRWDDEINDCLLKRRTHSVSQFQDGFQWWREWLQACTLALSPRLQGSAGLSDAKSTAVNATAERIWTVNIYRLEWLFNEGYWSLGLGFRFTLACNVALSSSLYLSRHHLIDANRICVWLVSRQDRRSNAASHCVTLQSLK